nr:MAG TPA: hypothetical protein [Bacteriophage sp.]
MLKGHAKIELKNEKTGKLDVIEHDNMITNGLNNILATATSMFSTEDLNSQYFPLNNKGMGGLLLFQNTLDESADNTLIPLEENNPLIGYASNDVNSGTDTKRGSRNLTESIKLDNGYKFVWDFTTSQANGQISALALTHFGTAKGILSSNILGLYNNLSITNNVSQDLINNAIRTAVDFDWNSNVLTCIKTVDTSTITVYKLKVCVGNIPVGINDAIRYVTLISQTNVTLPQSVLANTTWHNSDDEYYYGFGGGDYYQNKPYSVYRIKKSDYTLDESFTFSGSTQYQQTDYSGNWFKWNNNFYMAKPSVIHVLNLDSKTFSIIYNGGRSIALSSRNYLHAGTVFIKSDNSVVSRHSSDYFFNEISSNNEKAFVSPNGIVLVLGNSYAYGNYSAWVQMGVINEYLATINNLDSPVVKTSEQSMKITYTITEE